MDYFDVFRNLKGNHKHSRKSPEKAILLLAVINLFEKEEISDNEIRYNETLKSEYLNIWNQLLPYDNKLYSDAYIAFWCLEAEGFWHTVPKRKHSDVIELMRDDKVKPSEATLIECVDYAELDEELNFLMTMKFGRTELRAALMESSFDMTDEEITALKNDQIKDEIINKEIIDHKIDLKGNDINAISQSNEYKNLSIDTQIILNYEYFSFLKNNIYDRDWFLELFPSTESLYERITDHPLTKNDINPAFVFSYQEFLQDLKINLMCEDDTSNLIDSIEFAISSFDDGSRTETSEDTEIDVIANDIPDTGAIHEITESYLSSSKLDNISGVVEPLTDKTASTSQQEKQLDFFVENTGLRSYICNSLGNKVYSDSAKLKIFHGRPYRFNYKSMCLTVKSINRLGNDNWEKGSKVMAAYSDSDLYKALNEFSFIDDIEDLIFSYIIDDIKIKVRGRWYDYNGKALDKDSESMDNDSVEIADSMEMDVSDDDFIYEPKGNLKKIKEYAKSSYDLLFALAVVDMMDDWDCETHLSLDTIACKMIANAWQIIYEHPEVAEKQSELNECINFLIDESKDYMDVKLESYSTSKDVFDAIKDYPMAGVFEDTVEELICDSPYRVLKAWLNTDDKIRIVEESALFMKSCLYSINVRKHDTFIVINPKWKNALVREHDNLVRYFRILYKQLILSENNIPETDENIEDALCVSADLLRKADSSHHYFYVKSEDGAFGKGYYDADESQFVLVAGSLISIVSSASFSNKVLYDTVVSEKCDIIGGRYILRENVIFTTASQASSVVLGRYSNGWNEWIDDKKKTLKSVYRKDRFQSQL